MKSKNILNDDYQIDIGKLFKSLWKDKFIILVISAIFSVMGYFYAESLPRYYSTEIKIRNTHKYLFDKYDSLFMHSTKNEIYSAYDYYNQEFELLLGSSETIDRFVKQNKKYYDFLPYIYETKFTNNKNKKTKKFSSHLTFELVLTEKFDDKDFLNDYVMFVKQETEENFKNQTFILLSSKISDHEKNLEVSYEINLKDPILTSMVEGNTVVNEPEALFYRGSKVLERQLIHLKNLKSEIKEFSIDYNLILDKASPIAQISTPARNFIIPSFFVGMILSFFILLVRNSYKRS